jgi:hypothetical protein
MADPYVFGGSSFPYDGMIFQNQPYYGLEDGLADGNMPYIDPTLQSHSPNHYDDTWATLKENSTTALFLPDLCRQVPDHTSIRPAMGISPVPPPSHARLASPISSIEPSSSGSAHSPHADTESYHDNIPRTPPDTAALSPFQPSLSLEPFVHALQFSGMGSRYVNPCDVNPSQPPEYCESDNGIIDFNFANPSYNFDMNGSCDMEPTQSTSVSGFTSAGPDQMRPTVKQSVDTSSQYPPPPKDEDMGSDDDAPGKRQNDDDADGDYRPNKRQRTAARAPQRGMRAATTTDTTTTTTLSASSRRTRNPSTTNNKTPFTCPTCKQRNFPSKPDLDAHIKKQHVRSFNCVFDFAGCDSTFGSKNEWKRHVSTQHLLLHYWVCTEGTCAAAHATSPSPTPNLNPNGAIFNRKDLFTQHLKRMHAPKAVKDHLPSSKHRTTASTAPTTTTTSSAVTHWETRLKHLQENAIRPRCALPTRMCCPVPSCPAEPFQGQDAWNQRMEHVAKHMERAAQGKEPRVVFGGDGDTTLVRWAARGDVAIIVPRAGTAEAPADGPPGWGLKSPLRRGPGGNVVVVAPVRNGGGGGVGEEIVVAEGGGCGDGGGEEEEEDAEGEED